MIMKYGALAFFYLSWILFQTASASFDFWGVLDKYGYPTALSFAFGLFIWNRQKLADAERNGLIEQNNALTTKLLEAVKIGNACKFIEVEKKENV